MKNFVADEYNQMEAHLITNATTTIITIAINNTIISWFCVPLLSHAILLFFQLPSLSGCLAWQPSTAIHLLSYTHEQQINTTINLSSIYFLMSHLSRSLTLILFASLFNFLAVYAHEHSHLSLFDVGACAIHHLVRHLSFI